MKTALWTPSEEYKRSTNMFRFMEAVNAKHGLMLSDYPSLYRWSIENTEDFVIEDIPTDSTVETKNISEE